MLDRVKLRVALAKRDKSLAALCREVGVDYTRFVRYLGGYGSAPTRR